MNHRPQIDSAPADLLGNRAGWPWMLMMLSSLAISTFWASVTTAQQQPRLIDRSTPGLIGDQSPAVFLPFAQFQIPFNVEAAGTTPDSVLLLVSTDQGRSWQQHGKAKPEDKHFNFRAAAEGDYWFNVQTVDASGTSFPSPNPPLRVRVDTTKPQATVRADMDHAGNLIVDLRAADEHLDPTSAILRIRTDRDPAWREVPVTALIPVAGYHEAQVELLIPACREVALVFSVQDQAKNSGEASFLYTLPRTASGAQELQLASQLSSPSRDIPGAVPWNPSETGKLAGNNATAGADPRKTTALQSQGNYPTTPRGSNLNALMQAPGQKFTQASPQSSPGQLARAVVDVELGPHAVSRPEEISIPNPLPQQLEIEFPNPSSQQGFPSSDPNLLQGHSQKHNLGRGPSTPHTAPSNPDLSNETFEEHGFNKPYFCRTRTFSLDYSVEALGGNALSEVELWGTEDNGRSWEKWGADPDRVSPFDVKVGNDGLFGFRMVLLGTGGVVLGNPKPGEDADAWIRVDTEPPSCKITRAVYGVGSEAGMLVIDYSCSDSDLADEGISLHWSAKPDGPWANVASGLKNTGLYLWKADPGLPNRVYLKLEAVDKAGNVGVHRLDLPIDTKGLAPRGRIQGIRPIVNPN